MLTVIPRLVLLIGLSARRPLTGFKKHHAGTTPSSMFCPGSDDDLNRDLAVWTKVEFALPTTHHPSSNDCTTVSCSPRAGRSSSGRTGSNFCRTLRIVPDVLLIEEVPDTTENRLFVRLPKELRACDNSLGTTESKVANRGPPEGAKEEDVRANGLGGIAGFIMAFSGALSGRTMVESIICLEKPLVSVFDRLRSLSFSEPSS